MSSRHVNRLGWFIAVTAGLGGSSMGCSKEEPAASPKTGEAQTFRFAPPDGAEYVRIDRRTEEVAIVGAPLRRVENEELRWQVKVDRTGDGYEVKQDLAFLSYTKDGQTIAKGKVSDGVSAELMIDNNGNLMDVKGLDETAETLRTIVSAGKESEAANVITPEALAYIVSSRYKMLFGETIGRPAAPGSSWTITNPPGSFVTSRTVTVQRHEACDSATCARMQVDFQLDPQVLARAAIAMVKSRVSAMGGDAEKVAVRRATYGMTGWILVEPATMLSHGAMLTEAGTVTVADTSQQETTVEMKGTTELSYSYSGAPAASRPTPETKPKVAAE